MDLQTTRFGIIGGSKGLGDWFRRFLRQKGLTVHISSLDEKSEFQNNFELVELVEVVILAVPISAMVATLEEIFPHLRKKILIDICSVKEFLINRFIELQNQNNSIECSYYSIHPMFSGKLKKLEGQVILENYRSGKEDVIFWEAFKSLFLSERARWQMVDHVRHDKLMGTIQGLNHFNVFVSAKALSKAGYSLEDIKGLASPPYRIFILFFTRYVLQNPRLYAEIQLYNHHVLSTLKLFSEEMIVLMRTIENKDQQAFEEYVTSMQPFFKPHQNDSLLSDELIHTLGILLSE